MGLRVIASSATVLFMEAVQLTGGAYIPLLSFELSMQCYNSLLCVDACSQSVLGSVGQLDDLVLLSERDDTHDGAKHFFSHNLNMDTHTYTLKFVLNAAEINLAIGSLYAITS